MRSLLSTVLSAPVNEQGFVNWRSRDAAERLSKALQDPHHRPRWVVEVERSKHQRGKHPSVIITATGGIQYKLKALRSAFIVDQFRASYPDSDLILFTILPRDALSQIREQVYREINRIRQKERHRRWGCVPLRPGSK